MIVSAQQEAGGDIVEAAVESAVEEKVGVEVQIANDSFETAADVKVPAERGLKIKSSVGKVASTPTTTRGRRRGRGRDRGRSRGNHTKQSCYLILGYSPLLWWFASHLLGE